jgi:hypothetical protein
MGGFSRSATGGAAAAAAATPASSPINSGIATSAGASWANDMVKQSFCSGVLLKKRIAGY